MLTFEDDTASTASPNAVSTDGTSQHNTPRKTPALNANASADHSSRSRIPAAPSVAPTGTLQAGCFPNTASTAGTAAPAGSTAASLEAHGDAALELLNQHAAGQDSTWLSDGSSEEGLQQLTEGACLPADDAVTGMAGSSSSSVGSEEAGKAGVSDAGSACVTPAASGAAAGAAAGTSEGNGVSQQQPVPGTAGAAPADRVGGDLCAEGANSSSRSSVWGCMLLVWSVVLLAVGFLAAAVMVALQAPQPATPVDYLSNGLDDADFGILASTVRRYAI